MKTLLLFTGSYPFSVTRENTFLQQELEVLRSYFDRIILLPQLAAGERDELDASNVAVNTEYSAYIRSVPRKGVWLLLSVFDPRFLRECYLERRKFARHPSALLRAMRHNIVARLTEWWIRSFWRRTKAELGNCIFYTWWFDATTLGLSGLGRREHVPVITRVHGVDLYEDRHHPAYLPFRAVSLEKVSLVFSASRAGALYAARRHPAFSDKIRVSLLGVDSPGFLNSPSTDDVFRIVSCSFIVPVKRIDLLIRGLARLGRDRPERRFQWTHIGDGPREALVALAETMLPDNVEWRFMEYGGREALYDYYRSQPVDVFVNTSESEGTPVSVMEAISVGIPVVGTSVGGNPEIIGSENGILLPANPDPVEIADVLSSLLDDRSTRERFRVGSFQKWQAEYCASTNYAAFARSIHDLVRQ